MTTTVQTLGDLMTEIMVQASAHRPAPWQPTDEQAVGAAAAMAKTGYLPYDREAYEALARWLATLEAGHQRQGLLLTGRAGCGKTMFVKAVVRPSRLLSAAEIVNAYRDRQGLDSSFWYAVARVYDGEVDAATTIAVDDLGQEPLCMLYGQRVEVLDDVLCAVYRAWQKSGTLLVATSNLTIQELDKRYGRRITDRLREMCQAIEIKGGSRRGA